MIMLCKKAISLRIEELCSTKNITVNKLAEMSTVPPSTFKNNSIYIDCIPFFQKQFNIIYHKKQQKSVIFHKKG